MKKIFKYKLPRDGEIITIHADIIMWLDVQERNGWPHVWAIVDDANASSNREFEIVAWGTGWDVPEDLMNCGYLGTAVDGAGYVWHYFYQEVTPAYATAPVYGYDTLSVTGKACDVQPYTITISCGEADSAVSGLTIDTLQEAIEYITAAVASSNTATLRACT